MQADHKVSDAADAEAEIRGVRFARHALRPGGSACSIDVVESLGARPKRGFEFPFTHRRSAPEQARKRGQPCAFRHGLRAKLGHSLMDCGIVVPAGEIARFDDAKSPDRMGRLGANAGKSL